MRQLIEKTSPITGGPLELCNEPAQVVFRGETITFEKQFYHCVESGAEYADEEMETANLKRMYDTYRRNHGIPLAEELVQMRKRYGVPTRAVSLILGLGENQFGLYEDGAVPTVSVGKLLAIAIVPGNMLCMLQSAKNIFSDKEYRKYYKAIKESMYPAIYETEWFSPNGYETLRPALPGPAVFKTVPKSQTTKKEPYIEFAYAESC